MQLLSCHRRQQLEVKNVREWTVQRHQEHWADKTHAKDTQNTKTQHRTENENYDQHGPHRE